MRTAASPMTMAMSTANREAAAHRREVTIRTVLHCTLQWTSSLSGPRPARDRGGETQHVTGSGVNCALCAASVPGAERALRDEQRLLTAGSHAMKRSRRLARRLVSVVKLNQTAVPGQHRARGHEPVDRNAVGSTPAHGIRRGQPVDSRERGRLAALAGTWARPPSSAPTSAHTSTRRHRPPTETRFTPTVSASRAGSGHLGPVAWPHRWFSASSCRVTGQQRMRVPHGSAAVTRSRSARNVARRRWGTASVMR
jgi:hypothetical protein